MPSMIGGSRPKLTSRALRRWVPALVCHAPSLVTAYLVPGRIPPTIREAAMLWVTSVNRCQACESVHGRWAKGVGLRLDDLSPREAAAYAFGQRLAASGPREAGLPTDMSERHQRELLAVSILMELANLAGNRFLPPRVIRPTIQIRDARTARLLDFQMRGADRAGLRRARMRVAGRAAGDVLEIGVATGSNFRVYSEDVVVHGVDVSRPALSIAAERAASAGRRVTLLEADAEALPYADDTFDTVVATFVLCSVGNVGRSLREARRVLRPMSPPLFPVRLRDLGPRLVLHDAPTQPTRMGPFTIEAALVLHPGPTVGYRIGDGARTLAYLPDHEPALGWRGPSRTGRWTSGHDLAAGADLLIHDAQYTADEYQARVGWGHSSVDHALAFAELAGVGRLVTFHHDPSHSDDALDALHEAMIRQTRIRVEAGQEGVSLPF